MKVQLFLVILPNPFLLFDYAALGIPLDKYYAPIYNWVTEQLTGNECEWQEDMTAGTQNGGY